MDLAKIGLAVESKGLKEGIGNLRQLEGEGARTERGMSKLKGTVAAVSAAFAALGAQAFARDIIREAEQLNRNLLRTQQLIDTTGRSAERSAQGMREQARQIALATLQSTEGVMQAQQTLLTFRNITGETFDRALQSAVDLSAGLNQDVNTSIRQLGRALEDPIDSLNVLGRNIPAFRGELGETVKSMAEMGDIAGAQDLILQRLAETYGGVAAAEAQGLAGAQDTLGQRIQEAKLELADQLNLIENGVSAYNVMSGAVVSLTDNMDKVIQVTQALTVLIGSRLAAALATATAAKIAATHQAIAYQAALARMAGASAAATTAVGALRGALVLLGGPLGLLIGAGGLLYVFREELGLADIALNDVGKSAAKTDIALNNLSAAVDDSAEAALDASYQELTSQLFNVGRAAAAARVELAELEAEQNNRRTEQSNARGRRAIGPNGPEQGLVDAVQINKARKALAAYEAQEQKLFAGMERNEAARDKAAAARAERDKVRSEGIKRASDLLEGNTDSTDKNNISTREAARVTKNLAQETEQYANELESLRRSLDPAYARSQDFAQATALLDQALVTGKVTLTEYLALWDVAAERMTDAEDSTRDLADTTTDEVDAMSREWERFGNSVDDTFKDAFKGAFDSFNDFADRLKGAFENLLAELAYAAVKNEIKIQLGMDASGPMSGGISSIGNLIGDAFGAGSKIPGIGNLIGKAGSALGFGGSVAGASLGGMSGGLSSAAITSANAVAGGASTGLTGAMSSAMPWIGGGMLFDSVFDLGIGDAIKTGLFGGNWEMKDAGFTLGIDDGQIQGSQFERERKSGGLFRGSSHRTKESDLSNELEAGLQATLDAQDAAIRGSLEALGLQQDAFTGFNTEITKISTKGMEEGEAQAAIQSWLTGTVTSAVDDIADVSAFAREGEGSVETLSRLSQSLALVNPSLERLHGVAYDVSLSGADMASSLADAAGGLQSLDQLQSSYYQNFFSEAERAAHLQADVTESLSELGLQLPATRDGFRDLVEAQDLSTEAGREAYAALLSVSGAFDQLQPSSRGAEQRLTGAMDTLEGAIEREQNRLQSTHDAQMERYQDQISETSDSISELERSSRSLERAIESVRVESYALDRSRLQSARDVISGAAASGQTSMTPELESALSVVGQDSQQFYGTFEDYVRDQVKTSQEIGELNRNTEDELTVAQRTLENIEADAEREQARFERRMLGLDQQLESYQQQINALLGIDDGVTPLEDAINAVEAAVNAIELSAGGGGGGTPSTGGPSDTRAGNAEQGFDREGDPLVSDATGAIADAYRDILGRDPDDSGLAHYQGSGRDIDSIREEIAASDEAQRYQDSGIPGYANGGMHEGGWRVVGERGPELEWTAPSKIMSNSASTSALNTEAVRVAVDTMRTELGGYLRGIMTSTDETASTIDDWDTLGQPATRDVTA